jgi:hypothetical protein
MATKKFPNAQRKHVLASMRECDKMGAEEFRKMLNGRSSNKFVCRHNGKDYDSKLIMIRAEQIAGGEITPQEVSGGKDSPVARGLKGLGFKLTRIAFGVAATFAALSGSADAQAKTGEPAVYFASGSSRPGDIRGFATIKHSLGVAAEQVHEASESELYAIAGSGIPVFVDSGAFNERRFNDRHHCKEAKKCQRGECVGDGQLPRVDLPEGCPYTHKFIDEAEWQKRLDLYARLAAVYHAADAAQDLYLVAPDMIADQDVTLARLSRWAAEMRALRSLGVNILVVAQKGPEMDQAAFDAKVAEVLQFDDYVRALPCKKGATTLEELGDFCRKVKPANLHLLGMGVGNAHAQTAMDIIASASPETIVSMDSNKITANVGRQRDGVRPLTAARDLAEKLIAKGKVAYEDCRASIQELGIVLAFGRGYQLAVA